MRPIRINMDLATVDANSVFEDQQLAGAGNFTLNGVDSGTGEWISPDGFAHQISFESSGNLSGLTFTITGYADPQRSFALTEAVTGPNNATVESTGYFAVITSIASSGAVGTNVESGFVDEAVTNPIPLDWRAGNVGVLFDVTGTLSYTFQVTGSNVQSTIDFPFVWTDSDDTAVVDSTSSAHTNFIARPIAVRIKVNSYSTGAELSTTITTSDV